ncbi:MAG TPA: insulinase family protein [Edaphocola sp.]|nr:insulinase family protein [Edaphocola sp.]
MKKLFLSICAMALLTAAHAQQTLDRSIQPKPGPAPAINLKEPATFILSNGLKVFVVENHKMPIVTYSIQLDIRPELEGNKVGLHNFVGDMLTRGTTTMDKDAFDKAVDQLGASINASGSSIFGVSLSKYQDQLLTLMSDALLHPAFKQEELDKVIKQTKSGLIANENDADNMLSNVEGVVTYGKNHPYGEVMTLQTIQNVTLADCQQYYSTYFRPNVAYLAVVGDVTPEEAKTLVTKYFGSWEKADVPRTTYPKVSKPAQTTVDFVNRSGAVQSVIGITYPIDLQIGSADVIKAQAMNEILGGGSTGRLFQNLREKHGWTYGSYSSVSPDDIIGSVQVYAKCRNIVTDSSITEMLKEMNTIRSQAVDQAALDGVKNYMSGIFALRLESPQTIAQYAINIDRFDMPKDYYKNYLKNVAQVTTADVQAMAQKYILPNQAHIVVVGNTSEVDKLKQFSADGKINYYDAYGNPVEPAVEKVVDGKKIDDVMAMYINAMGGKTAIEGLKDLKVYANMKVRGNVVARINTLTISPDKYMQTMTPQANTGGAASGYADQGFAQQKAVDQQMDMINKQIKENSSKTVIVGDKGYRERGSDKMDLNGEAIRPYQAEADLQSILHPEKYGISYELLGMDTAMGINCYTVSKVSNNGQDKAILYINNQNGQLVMKRELEDFGAKKVLTKRYYSDYQEVKSGNGYKIPFKIKVIYPQQDERDIEISSAKANSGIKDNKFKL